MNNKISNILRRCQLFKKQSTSYQDTHALSKIEQRGWAELIISNCVYGWVSLPLKRASWRLYTMKKANGWSHLTSGTTGGGPHPPPRRRTENFKMSKINLWTKIKIEQKIKSSLMFLWYCDNYYYYVRIWKYKPLVAAAASVPHSLTSMNAVWITSDTCSGSSTSSGAVEMPEKSALPVNICSSPSCANSKLKILKYVNN